MDKYFSHMFGVGLEIGELSNENEKHVKYIDGTVEEYWKIKKGQGCIWENRHPDCYRDVLEDWTEQKELSFKYLTGIEYLSVDGLNFYNDFIGMLMELKYLKAERKKDVFVDLRKAVGVFRREFERDNVGETTQLFRYLIKLSSVKDILEANLYFDESVHYGCDCGCGGDSIDDEMIEESNYYEGMAKELVEKIEGLIFKKIKI